ncbi:glycosyltransferase family 2 protein [Pedobacter sp. UBA4863]|uniref:glycosyltransferase family 2 protein n=1 Tax=Pedobacter sp. UBA4863 TaxID=1947060 RepID=UPI0025E22CF6|nr:glycosyltransferase family 2 protein [Pedobacter sp. UBA4863]
MPLLSIITINYNNAKGLQKTIESVVNQSFKDYEYIIIDGGSNDGSKDIIHTYNSYFHYATSEPDNGVYHAMNKGVKTANGTYLLFLNSGDVLYHNETLLELAQQVNEKPNYDIYYSNLLLSDPHTQTERLHRCPEKLTLSFFLNSFIGHPAALIKRATFNNMGAYAEHYDIISDWLFFVKAFLKGYSFQYVNLTVATFFLDGISSEGNQKHSEELQKVYQKELNFIAEDVVILKRFNARPHQWIAKLLSYIRKND